MLVLSWYQGVKPARLGDCRGVILASGKGDGWRNSRAKHSPSFVNALELQACAWSLTPHCLGTSKLATQ